jgi:hemoglobin
MGRAMKDLSYDDALIERMLEVFFGVADWMRNKDG